MITALILPLIKDKKGDAEDASNYRSICISSIMMKILDWIVLLLFGNNLKVDDLQFGYVEHSNTELASRTLINTISKYLRNGSSCYIMFADCTKEYDLIKHSGLSSYYWKEKYW